MEKIEEIVNDVEPSQDHKLGRRELIKTAVGAAIAAPLLGREIIAQKTARRKLASGDKSKTYKPRFFTRPEYLMLDELTEIIIPTDSHSPGAKEAMVAAYIDGRLADAPPSIPDNAELRKTWRDGLKLVDDLSRQLNSKGFMAASPEQQISVVSKMAENEEEPKTPAEEFFALLKTTTARGYYTTKIGIKQEMEYLGNTYEEEFVGYDVDGTYHPRKSRLSAA